MKKPEFVKAVAEAAGVTQKVAAEVIDCTADVIMGVIARNDQIKFGNLCTFKGVDVPSRVRRNPQTGQTFNSEPKTGYPKCKFSKAAKE